MTPPSPVNFTHKNLRGRNFRNQQLEKAYFAGCDLRGCDFFRANLRGALFTGCRTGYSPEKLTIGAVTLILATGLMFHAVSSFVFGAVGILPNHPAWLYVLALYVTLGLATLGTGWQSVSMTGERFACILTGITTGALMGFFYGGQWTDNNPQIAIGGATLIGGVGLMVASRRHRALSRAVLGGMGAIAAYGFTFLLWAEGSSLVTTGTWGRGLGLMLIALTGIGVTLRSITCSWRWLKTYGHTSFRQADLTACTFIDTDLTV